ncbi:antigen 5 like allergen Cul n 1-like [Stomoxys calcitrans]|uniref:antigen 5 like allergen Cul n 1-like n=1 Tax=Stomoxys calcitrans TaxID=35570 RepID=UPI0027E3A008|nr:antigen 5 like allergen Cul n 1-like [Stomoxys calcitrans]
MSLILNFLIIGAITLARGQNYCERRFCERDQRYHRHIACGHNGQFDRSCIQPAMVPIDSNLQNFIVSDFNAKRNFIAGGGNRNYRPACRMGTMLWDNELARLAEMNVRQCRMEHDCHATIAFPIPGQNLAWQGFFGNLNAREQTANAINGWFNEHELANMDFIRSYRLHPSGRHIGHFTAMMVEKNIRIGCAASTYNTPGNNYRTFLIACNFAATNMFNEPIYTDCNNGGQGCTSGRNPQYTNLCSINERYTF